MIFQNHCLRFINNPILSKKKFLFSVVKKMPDKYRKSHRKKLFLWGEKKKSWDHLLSLQNSYEQKERIPRNPKSSAIRKYKENGRILLQKISQPMGIFCDFRAISVCRYSLLTEKNTNDQFQTSFQRSKGTKKEIK